MEPLRITDTPSVQRMLSDLGGKAEVTAADIVWNILQSHTQYGFRTASEVAGGKPPDLDTKQTAERWLDQVRSMFDPVLVNQLHGRLVILALCRLEEKLGDYLQSFVNDLKKELIEDFDSLLLPEYAGEQKYRRDFIKILQNQSKLVPDPDSEFPTRSSGFVIFARGDHNLDELTRLCFKQRYNSCFTAHYKLSSNAWEEQNWQEFERLLLSDLHDIANQKYGTIGHFQPELGVNLRPGTAQKSWRSIVTLGSTASGTSSQASPDVPSETPRTFQSLLDSWQNSALVRGDRVILFIEWLGTAQTATRESLGINDDVLKMLQSLPERVGVVMSGLPESVTHEIQGEHVHVLTLPKEKAVLITQELLNDTPTGPDRLNIAHEVEALADAIALKETHPPLVVGIFGGWGSGKSFVLHLIEQHLQNLRCREAHSKFPYVGHTYLIRFDAWTYAKNNLWASLMQTTLVGLDRQLSLERELADTLNIDLTKASDIWRVLGNLTDRQRNSLLKTELGRKAIEKVADFTKRGCPGQLWNELEKLRDEEKQQLDIEEAKLCDLKRQQISMQREVEAEVDRELSANARLVAWMPIWQEIAGLVGNKLSESDAPTFEKVVESVSLPKKFVLGITNLSIPVATFMVIALAGGFVVAYFEPLANWWSQAAGGLVALAAPLLNAWNWFEKRRQSYEQRLATAQTNFNQLREERIKEQIDTAEQNTPGAKLAMISADVEDTEARVNRIRSRLGVIGHSRSLNDFLKTRIEEGLYQKELGLLDKIQSDIKELSDTLLLSQAQGTEAADKRKQLFPRGEPRIVLFIDDLDRCPPEKVVEVLEAAQLLVKTRLFVVVISMDVRYVTRALEAQYKDVLVRSGEPSGLDYIEKIIQIPYRVRTASKMAIKSYLRTQMEVHEPAEGGEAAEPRQQTKSTDEKQTAGIDSADEQVKKARLSAAAQATQADATELTSEAIHFTPEEYTTISNACSALAVSPRTMKRLVNVFKLLKIIWHRQGLDKGPSIDVKQAMMSTLALCAKYPEVLRKLLTDMESVFRNVSVPSNTPLVSFLMEKCIKGAQTALYPPDWYRVSESLQNSTFFPQNITFSRLQEANLNLLSSFSFVGETDSEREATLQRGYYKNATTSIVKKPRLKEEKAKLTAPPPAEKLAESSVHEAPGETQ